MVPVDRYFAGGGGAEIICAVKENLERAAVDQMNLGDDSVERTPHPARKAWEPDRMEAWVSGFRRVRCGRPVA